ncbi:hypothetical protein CRN67_08125 [Campylobacter blaseri]|uniref:Uncharacterized protein n=1 Tax=Campylobacter blaseri TaxID=2042961 RepID=A0A2P8QZ42_9BACT|nr:hypothetical protein CQ405_08120 [Campylobacter blaseri]PSM52969.1 hypothetical protein CRN67_08125 [Campylobacter blaseri]
MILFLKNIYSKKKYDLTICVILMVISCFFIFLNINAGFIRSNLPPYILFFLFFYAFLDALKHK